MKTLFVIPTYNEAGNIGKIMDEMLAASYGDIFVVDDNSADGTKDTVRRFLDSGNVFMLERPSKLGLGTAYIAGFEWGLKRGYELFFEIDADLSHDTDAIPDFVKKIEEGFDMVVGSRYLNNTISVVGWDFKRLLLSKFGNYYIQSLTPLKKFTDMTSGFRCYTRKTLETVNLDKVKSNGYAFQIEMVYRVFNAGLRIVEIPIIFYERNGGSSKMSPKIVREAVMLPFRLKMEKFSENKRADMPGSKVRGR